MRVPRPGSLSTRQMAAHRLRALPHIEKSEMSRGRRLPGNKTLTVIAHGQANGRGAYRNSMDTCWARPCFTALATASCPMRSRFISTGPGRRTGLP